MTQRQLYEYVLIELNKVHAPALLLADFNYIARKGIGQYTNKVYNLYDINQQKSDDLRVLKSTAVLTPFLSKSYVGTALYNNIYEVFLPDDYLHILGCIVEYTGSACDCSTNQVIQYGAKRLTADMFPQLMSNYYMRPSYKNPYYYINNVNESNTFETSDDQTSIFTETITVNLHEYATTWTTNTIYEKFQVVKIEDQSFGSDRARFFICNTNHTSGSVISETYFTLLTTVTKDPEDTWATLLYTIASDGVDKTAKVRYGNKSKVKMEIRYGNGCNLIPSKIYVDYLKVPQHFQLTEDLLDEVIDYSPLLEFPDYVCQEIVNEIVKLALESASDPRLQTNIPVSQSIGLPEQVKNR